MTAKCLCIGLDAFDGDLARHWMAEGALPNLKRLVETGSVARVLTPPGLFAGAAWPTFYTGVMPDVHGRYYRRQLESGTYLDEDVLPTDVRTPAIWKTLGDAGRRVAVIDVPHASLYPGINGIQLVDWSSHDPEEAETLSSPPELVDELAALFGKPRPDACEDAPRNPKGLQQLGDDLLARIENKTVMAGYLLGREDWDLFLVSYGESHCAGHQLWALHDHGHPASSITGDTPGDPLKAVYAALDAAVGRLMEAAGPGSSVFVLGSHGMGPFYNEASVLDDLLALFSDGRGPDVRSRSYRFLRSLFMRIPEHVRRNRKFAPLKEKLRKGIQSVTEGQARARQPWFQIPSNPCNAAIRINLKGREPNGVIDRGQHYEETLTRLVERLNSVTINVSDRPLISSITRVDDAYPGVLRENLPDLLIEWNRSEPVRSIQVPGSDAALQPAPHNRSGCHRADGVLFCTPTANAPDTMEIIDVSRLVVAAAS